MWYLIVLIDSTDSFCTIFNASRPSVNGNDDCVIAIIAQVWILSCIDFNDIILLMILFILCYCFIIEFEVTFNP